MENARIIKSFRDFLGYSGIRDEIIDDILQQVRTNVVTSGDINNRVKFISLPGPNNYPTTLKITYHNKQQPVYKMLIECADGPSGTIKSIKSLDFSADQKGLIEATELYVEAGKIYAGIIENNRLNETEYTLIANFDKNNAEDPFRVL